MQNDIINLISETLATNEYGELSVNEQSRQVFAEVKSVGYNEFYQAMANGLKPEIKFTIADFLDYNGEKQVEYNGIRYKVLRTYRSGIELELVCYGGAMQNANT